MTRLLPGACSALAMKPRRHDAVVEGKGDLAYGKVKVLTRRQL
jgi:hypothetical protein